VGKKTRTKAGGRGEPEPLKGGRRGHGEHAPFPVEWKTVLTGLTHSKQKRGERKAQKKEKKEGKKEGINRMAEGRSEEGRGRHLYPVTNERSTSTKRVCGDIVCGP